jgi:serine/threonine protein kinase
MQALMSASATAPTIAGFRVDRLIGEGGFGQVWRGTSDEDGRIVAIKVLHLELIESSDAMTRFEREQVAIERLDHRNVVRAYGHGTLADGRPYLVLELIDGPTLRDVIRERGQLPPAEALAMLAPLCEALAVVHELGLVHRDVKASNVILGSDANGARPVLLDFGLVKLTDQTSTLTSSRNMLGTPTAMAPEQLMGEVVTARTDVYALGLLAFHMLTGQPAFGHTTGLVQTYLQLHGTRPRPSAKADLDQAIDAPIMRALAPEPGDRFASAREFLQALRDAITPSAPSCERDVIALYVEGGPAELAAAANLSSGAGMMIAMTTPDSLLAVAPIGDDTGMPAIRDKLDELAAAGARIAIASTRATIAGTVIDGPALDVEGWAPYPLAAGVWVSAKLLV